MREIKFRGQCHATNEWVFGLPLTMTTLSHSISHISQFAGPDRKFGRENVMIIPETVGQYTGLKDKNGVEIYEGDVLTNDFYPFKDDGMNNYIGLVKWIFSSWQIVMKCVNPLKSGISNGINHDLAEYSEDSETLNFEIIGNIHSNPELLK